MIKPVEVLVYSMEGHYVSIRTFRGNSCLPEQLYAAGFRPGDLALVVPRERLAYLEQVESLSTRFLQATATPTEMAQLISMLDPPPPSDGRAPS